MKEDASSVLGRVWLGALAELIKAVEASASVGG